MDVRILVRVESDNADGVGFSEKDFTVPATAISDKWGVDWHESISTMIWEALIDRQERDARAEASK